MRKSKNRYFYHILVSPGDAPGVITLNVVWMEREFDAYKLSRCMCPSKYNRFWDTARYLSKIAIFSYPLHSTPPLGGFPLEYCHAVWYGKTRMAWLPEGEKKFEDTLTRFGATHERDGQTDGQTNVMFRRQNALSGNFTIPFIIFSRSHREEMTAVRCIWSISRRTSSNPASLHHRNIFTKSVRFRHQR